MKNSEIKMFSLFAADYPRRHSEQAKARFHRDAKRMARSLVLHLALPRGSFEIRSNLGGPAVCGEVRLHGESIYIQFSGDAYHGVLFRSCKGRTDYSGGPNQWIPWDRLPDMEETIQRLKWVLLQPVS